jgi:diguanylate cyclase (GGDEF)-like protein
MAEAESQVVRITSGLAAGVALALATLTPIAYYRTGIAHETGSIQADTGIKAYLLTELIRSRPRDWRDDTARLREILEIEVHHTHAEGAHAHPGAYRVLGADGAVVLRSPEAPALAAPVLVASRPVAARSAAGVTLVGEVSLRPLLEETALVAALASLAALAAFVGFRALPIRALRRALAAASFLASHDPLTGLPNRALFQERLRQAVADAQRRDEDVAVLCLDLDHFKDVNDTLGHPAGDQLLQRAAARLRRCLRQSDTLARLGGDEFMIIQSGGKQPQTAVNLAQRVIETLGEPFDLDGREVVVGCSIGIVIGHGADRPDPEQLLGNSDLALYRAKSDGRGTFCFFEEEMNARLQARKSLEGDLRRALAERQFRVFFQPQVELKSGRIVGVEALARWLHPERGWVAAADFIPLTEETGLIIRLGEWILRAACTEAAPWRPLKVAVNLSPAQFRHPGLIGMVAEILRETGFEPARLELEITEGILLGDTETTFAILQALKALGVGIVMDDFGTGYSSLGYLRQFKFDKIKIDRSFIQDLHQTTQATSIVRAVVALGHSLGMRANAEGVETVEQAEILSSEGCEEVQGYFFGRPMPGAEFAALLAAGLDRSRRVG